MKGNTTDLKQVGVIKYANDKLRELVENQDYFDKEQDVYRLGVALAIALRLEVKARRTLSEIRAELEQLIHDHVRWSNRPATSG